MSRVKSDRKEYAVKRIKKRIKGSRESKSKDPQLRSFVQGQKVGRPVGWKLWKSTSILSELRVKPTE